MADHCCNHACREGRDCPRRMQLHRLQPSDFPRVHQQDGGMRVSGRDSVRLPAPSPRSTAPTSCSHAFLYFAATVALALVAAVFHPFKPF